MVTKLNLMKFYNRTSEIKELQRIQKLSFDSYSRMTVITGRQRIGKTSLVVEATKGEGSIVYLFVSRKMKPRYVKGSAYLFLLGWELMYHLRLRVFVHCSRW